MDDWRSWKNGRHDNRYKGVKRHPGKRSYTLPIIISVILASAILGYFAFQTYAIPQPIQKAVNNVINNTSNTIQQVSSQVNQQSNSILGNSTLSSTNQNNRMPIAVFNDCSSFLRTDLKYIDTTCFQKRFEFAMPTSLVEGLGSEDIPNVKTIVYQYGNNDFKIGLYDQVGEKNYTVSLWQLPQ